ncbi:peptidoglycan D,D-transpeptidase FtsI family protein [Chrysiogenes arsenatis]|uniref:peptidoglycan D,D-transpeptidase FtsI family protein n=1 Tax=Chrysiogenes arsenatis TaxID=309797 RepID=UPI0004138CF4|nr:penicillin-binding protein 2 [Chrysiogenes arsenatis]
MKQIVHHDYWAQKRQAQYTKDFTVKQQRADIHDRNGLPLALSSKAYNVYGVGSEIEEIIKTSSHIATALGLKDYGPIYERIHGRSGFFWIARNVPPAQAAKIGEIKGVGLLSGEQRSYPSKELFSRVLGFTGVDAQGLEGVERRFDDVLIGDELRIGIYRDARRRDIMLETLTQNYPLKKEPLRLSLDSQLQTFIHDSVSTYLVSSKPKSITVVAMDPWSGEVLAAYGWPNYDPENYQKFPKEKWKNIFITDVFEPGSTYKLVTFAAALQSGKATPQDMFFGENGVWRDGNREIRDTHPVGHINTVDAFVESSNIITAKIALSMEPEYLYRFMTNFGFGQKTGIELHGESPGLLRPPKQWSKLSRSSLAMGYEMSANALQMVRLYSAIANGGYLVTPTILRRTTGEEIPRERVLDEQVALTLKHMLLQVVERGTAKSARLKHYTLCGKTGTSQKLDPVKGYNSGKYFSSFVGFFPYESPRVVVGVFVDEPEGKYYGGAVAAPIFRDIAAKYINFHNILPDKAPTVVTRGE